MPWFCLSIHADYGCRHSGACCSSWFVPAEPHVVEFVTSGRLAVSTAESPFLNSPASEGPSMPRIAHGHDGTCLLRTDNRCSIHSEAGPSALPTSCRHYPRIVRWDEGGTRVSLSHYCPTAASLLTSSQRPVMIGAPPGLVLDDPIEGLDARDTLPPLTRPGMLSDLGGYTAWEDLCVGTLARHGDAATALGVIGVATEALRAWTPSAGSLIEAVEGAFAAAEQSSSRVPVSYAHRGGEIVRTLASTAPALRHVSGPPLSSHAERTIANYLAARAFGNWLCYQGRGLRTVVAWLHACNEIVRGFAATLAPDVHVVAAIQSADFLMLHTIDSQSFADAAIPLEH